MRLGLAVLIADQATKVIVENTVDVGERHQLLPGVAIELTRNTGVAFSIGGGTSILVVLATILAVSGLCAFFFFNRAQRAIWLPAGLMLGGAIGNIIDRFRHEAVTDFINLPVWPTFNIADVSIVAGVLAMIVITWKEPETPKA